MNAVKRAATLYECRDAAKRLLGEHYSRDMALWATAIKADASRLQCSDLQAAIAMAKDTDGFQTLVILAAAVEMIEPSTASTPPPSCLPSGFNVGAD